ncbi:SDR family NAD(P)-dependent oxidoreductase [Kribbella sp. NPDC004536]|uniref:SDR family NAD(P)-dependent oxidoreductase n=1 Tax=Kribbella sp. NPDC004536 TaxID=3364106 RepID=UPI00369E601E
MTLDTLLDRLVVLGYTRLGYKYRARTWPSDDPEPQALKGKTVIVTGARTGLGKATAAALANLGATVRLAVRDPAKAQDALTELQSNGGTYILDQCDVADLTSVRHYASTIEEPIHALIHNAGVMPPVRTESPQGHELTLATHVLGPLLLTELLKHHLSRVIFVASGGMYTQPLPEDPEYRDAPYKPAVAYARTKRIQVDLTPLMATHFAPTTIATMHPGWSHTPGLTTSLPTFTRLTGPLLRTPAQGADTTIWLAATDPAPPTGNFWHDRKPRPTHYLPHTKSTTTTRTATWTYCQTQAGLPTPTYPPPK